MGGIIVPDVATVRAQRGTVLSTGPDVHQVEIGAAVHFGPWAGTLTEDGDHCIMREQEILLVEDGDGETAD